jgi:pimeloyl-ACP methyl ester carboxylesterase
MLYSKSYIKGPAHDWVIFIHGAGGSSSIWFRQLRDFREHFNVLLVDLRGHGRSQPFIQSFYENKYTFEAVSRDVLDVLDEKGIGKAHFVGISLGSIIIRTISDLAPERVQSMVMGGAVTRLTVKSRLLVAVGNAFKKIVPFIWLYSILAWVIMPRRHHAESRTLFIREARRLCQKEFLRWIQLTSEMKPVLRLFHEKESHLPTLYLMGEQDHMFLPPVKQLVQQHQHSYLEVFRNCGHVCNVDQPHLFNKKAICFILTNKCVA